VSDNRDQVFSALKAWQKRMDEAGMRATRLITRDVQAQAQKNASQVKNPPIQKNNKLRHNPHIGPRAGEGPNYATGNLFRGIQANAVRRSGFESYVASVSSTVEYARAVEEGSSKWLSGVKFPYMIPARDYVVQSGRARAFMRDEVKRAMGA
jgi:Bacteriophage HK97-gp10, putative tail-component